MDVLVVDDNADAVESLCLCLELVGHTTARAKDGPSALEAAARLRPEAVVLDVKMPGMSGHEVARRLRDDPANDGVLIVVVSGYAREEDRQKSLRAGADHHFAKPADPDALLRLISEHVRAGKKSLSPLSFATESA